MFATMVQCLLYLLSANNASKKEKATVNMEFTCVLPPGWLCSLEDSRRDNVAEVGQGYAVAGV